MALVRTVPPTVKLVDIEMVKAQARIDTDDELALLGSYVRTAREYAERVLGRSLNTQTWQLTLDGGFPRYAHGHHLLHHHHHDPHGAHRHPRRIIRLPMPPVQSVTSIEYVDLAGATQTLDASKYNVDLNAEPALIEEAHGETWPDTRDQLAAVTVIYVAGYGDDAFDVPETIRNAVSMLAAHWFDHRAPTVVGSTVNDVPFTVDALLDQYRMFDV